VQVYRKLVAIEVLSFQSLVREQDWCKSFASAEALACSTVLQSLSREQDYCKYQPGR
jgi:hypothetical protein